MNPNAETAEPETAPSLSTLLVAAGANAQAATDALDRLMRSWPDEPELRAEIKRLEEEGDRLTHQLLHRAGEREDALLDGPDVHALAGALDDVVDLSEEAADVLGLYSIEAPMEQAVELTGVLRDGGRQIAAAISELDASKALSARLAEIDRLEDEGDRISREALASLFAGGIDPMVVIRWKDVFERLEQAIDACERVAHVLEGIVVKRG